MKSVKMFLGMMICMCVFAMQSHAATQEVILDFDLLSTNNQIVTYGNDYGVNFTGNWFLGIEDTTNTIYKRLTTNVGSNVGIGFVENPSYKIDSFLYLSYDDVAFTANYWDTDDVHTGTLVGLGEEAVDLVSFSVSNLYTYGLLKSITFSRDATTTSLFLDDVKLTAVPVPAAALLLGAGLLGIVGIRRRQVV